MRNYEKAAAWVMAILIAIPCWLLALGAFLGRTPVQTSKTGFLNHLITTQTFLLDTIGGTPTGIIFALVAIGLLVAALQYDPPNRTR